MTAHPVAPTVLTMGTFDLFHAGHVALLRECRKLAGPSGRVVAAVNADAFVGTFKLPPTLPYALRADVVAACRYVDEVVENVGDAQPDLIAGRRPDWLVVGVDWAGRDYHAQLGITPDWLAERGISLVYVGHEMSTVISTTRIRRELAR